MRVLELRAVNLDARPRIPKQRLRHGFDHACLARSCRPQKQQVPHRTPGRIQPRQEHLVDFDDLFYGGILAYDSAAQGPFKLSSIVAATVRIEHCSEIRSHKIVSPGAPGHFSLSAVLGSSYVCFRTFQANPCFSDPFFWKPILFQNCGASSYLGNKQTSGHGPSASRMFCKPLWIQELAPKPHNSSAPVPHPPRTEAKTFAPSRKEHVRALVTGRARPSSARLMRCLNCPAKAKPVTHARNIRQRFSHPIISSTRRNSLRTTVLLHT